MNSSTLIIQPYIVIRIGLHNRYNKYCVNNIPFSTYMRLNLHTAIVINDDESVTDYDVSVVLGKSVDAPVIFIDDVGDNVLIASHYRYTTSSDGELSRKLISEVILKSSLDICELLDRMYVLMMDGGDFVKQVTSNIGNDKTVTHMPLP